MKKLLTLMLGVSLLFGPTTAFAQDNPPKKTAKKTSGKKKGGKKKSATAHVAR
jgi:hypothetical protein